MKIALSLQYNDAFKDIADITVPVIQAYALRHGYSVFVHKCDSVSPEICWQRVEDVAKLLPDFEMVVHLDADLLITNPDIRLGMIAAEQTRTLRNIPDVLVSTDCNGINDGCCMWFRKWSTQCALKELMAVSVTKDTSLQNIMEGKSGLSVHKMPQRLTNSYLHAEYGIEHPEGEWQPGDFILHLPGIGNARRIEILKAHLTNTDPAYL